MSALKLLHLYVLLSFTLLNLEIKPAVFSVTVKSLVLSFYNNNNLHKSSFMNASTVYSRCVRHSRKILLKSVIQETFYLKSLSIGGTEAKKNENVSLSGKFKIKRNTSCIFVKRFYHLVRLKRQKHTQKHT